MPVQARLRFGPLRSLAIPREFRGDSVDVWCDFRDIITGDLVDVSGVTATVWLPSGAEVEPALTPTEEAPGTWYLNIPTAYSGTWSVSMRCASPNVSLDRRDFVVEALSPDPGPAPDPEWPVLLDLVADAEAAVTAAQTARDAALAGQAAAESAAASARGVLLLAGIAGTSTAYTSTTDVPVVEGLSGIFVPHVDSGPSPTLKLGTQTARSLRFSGTSAATAGMFIAGRSYPFVVRLVAGTPVFACDVDNVGYHFGQQNIVSSGGTFLNYWQALTDAHATVRFFFGTNGRFDVSVGTGAATAALGLRVSAERQLQDGRGRPVYSTFSPPPLYVDAIEQASEGADRTKSDYGNETVNISSGGIYQFSPPNQGKLTRFLGSNTATFHHGGPGDEYSVSVESGTLLIHTGYVGATAGSAPLNILTTGTPKATIAAPWHGRIIRRQGVITLRPDEGSSAPASSTASIGTYSRGVFWIGQSWADQETDSALFGMQEEFERMGLNRSVLSARFTARGASGLWKNGVSTTSDPNNYWYNEDTDALGPNATACLTAIGNALAAEGAPAAANWTGVFIMGLPDLLSLATGGYYTPAQYTTDLARFFTLFRAQLELLATGLGSAKILICPLPTQDPGAFNALTFGPLRKAQLGVCLVDSNCRRGPDLPHVRPFNNRHHYLAGRAEHGRMLARAIRNIGGGSEVIGPKITSFTRLATNSFRMQMDRNGCTALNREIVPVCVGIALSSAALAARLTIKNISWTWGGTEPNDYVDFETTGDDGTSAIHAYWPDGPGAECQEMSRVPYAFDALGRRMLPLTFHPSV